MNLKQTRIIAIFRLLALLTSATCGCGTSLGFLRDSTTSQTFKYEMNLKEIKMQRTVSASTEAKTIVCLIPTDGDPPYATAMERLHTEAKLGPNEVLVNIREDKRILVYLIYCKHRLTLSADVYKLGSGGARNAHEAAPAASRPAEGGAVDQESGAKSEAVPKRKTKNPKPVDPCKEKYWECMEYCGTRGCGQRCVKEQKKCEKKGTR